MARPNASGQIPGLDAAAKVAPLSESDLIARLRARYTEKAGNGDAWAFIPQVRSAAGFDARRTIDAYAMSLWPSRGLGLTAFELKSSRSDWVREMRNPAKAEEFCVLVDQFYLVTGAKGIVQTGELPETWGLMVPTKQGLKVEVEAPMLRDRTGGALPPGFGRSFLAALLRAATFVGSARPEEVRVAVEEASAATRIEGERLLAHWEARAAKAEETVRAFENASGVLMGESWSRHKPAEVGRALKLLLEGDHDAERLEERMRNIQRQATAIADEAAKQLGEAED